MTEERWQSVSDALVILLRHATDAAEVSERMEAKVDRLETLVRELIQALKAGAVGRWQW